MTTQSQVNAGRRRCRRRLALVAAGLLALAGLVAGGAASAATPTPKPAPSVFGIGPSGAKALDGRPYYYFLAGQGSRLSDHVAVVNVGLVKITLSVYASDATNSPDGSFAFPPAAVRPTEVGTWIHITTPSGTDQVVVPGRTTLYLPITVRIPDGAVPGDHAGAIIASLRGEARGSNGELIHLDQRVATRMFVRVSGPLHPRLAVQNLSVTYQGSLNPFAKGTAVVTYTVHNTGNVNLAANQTVEVTGLFGVHASAVKPPQVPLLLPGGSATERVEVNGVPPTVWMTATVTLRPLGLPSDVDPKTGPWTASAHFWAIPWLLLLLLLAVVLGTLGWQWRRRRQAHRPGGAQGGGSGYDGPDGDTGPDGGAPYDQMADDRPGVGSRP